MSLINDALKRATQNPASSASAQAPEPHAPMQPVEYRRARLPWFFFPTLLLILAGACWLIAKGLQSNRLAGEPVTLHAREPQPNPAPAPSHDAAAAQLIASGFTPPAPDTASTTAAAPLPNRNFSLDDSAPTAAAAPAPVSAEPPKPAFRLQGIFYRNTNPSATINGKNVTVGSRINGATVTAITRDGVTLEATDGQTMVLTLE